MFTFVQLQYKDEILPGWFLKLPPQSSSNEKSQLDDIISYINNNFINGLDDIIMSQKEKHHCTTAISGTLYILSMTKEDNVSSIYAELKNNIINNIIQKHKEYTIYFNSNFAFFYDKNNITFHEINYCIKDDIIFPKFDFDLKNVRFLKWYGGKHWYAKINNEDIVINGQQKWDSLKQAKEEILKYFNK